MRDVAMEVRVCRIGMRITVRRVGMEVGMGRVGMEVGMGRVGMEIGMGRVGMEVGMGRVGVRITMRGICVQVSMRIHKLLIGIFVGVRYVAMTINERCISIRITKWWTVCITGAVSVVGIQLKSTVLLRKHNCLIGITKIVMGILTPRTFYIVMTNFIRCRMIAIITIRHISVIVVIFIRV